MTLTIGIVGCGAVVHRNYAPTLLGRREYDVAYVVDRNRGQAESAAALFGASVVELDELDAKVDAVIVATPPESHAPIVTSVLRPNRIVLCEKPFLTSWSDALRLTQQAHAIGAKLYVGHFRRTFPQLVLARELVQAGLIGDVTYLSASEGGRFTWTAVSDYTLHERTGGVLWDTGSHTLDMALFAAGLDDASAIDVVDVAVTRDRPEPSHELRASFVVERNGRRIAGDMRLSRRQAPPNLVRVRGTAGEIVFVTGLDDRVRLFGSSGSTVVVADHSYGDLLECVDAQNRRVLLQEDASVFEADRFLAQLRILEALGDG